MISVMASTANLIDLSVLLTIMIVNQPLTLREGERRREREKEGEREREGERGERKTD